MKSSTAIKRARARLADPKAWTQGALAASSQSAFDRVLYCLRDLTERRELTATGQAPPTCWCTAGALLAEVPAERGPYHTAFAYIYQQLPFPKPDDRLKAIAEWNDAAGRSHADVLGVLDRAISTALAEGK